MKVAVRKICRACRNAPAIRRGLSATLCAACLRKLPKKRPALPVRPPVPAYQLTRAAVPGVTRPSLAIAKGVHRSTALRQSARDEACVACGKRDGSIVWAHSNEGAHGKAKSMKCHDLLGNYLCADDHRWYDEGPASREEKQAFFRECYPRSMVRVAEKLAAGTLRL